MDERERGFCPATRFDVQKSLHVDMFFVVFFVRSGTLYTCEEWKVTFGVSSDLVGHARFLRRGKKNLCMHCRKFCCTVFVDLSLCYLFFFSLFLIGICLHIYTAGCLSFFFFYFLWRGCFSVGSVGRAGGGRLSLTKSLRTTVQINA